MNAQQNDFMREVVPAAQAAMRRYGVPASVTVAQAILESSWGASSLARKANNFFGIKAVAHATPEKYAEFATQEYVSGRAVKAMARFARYACPADSFEAHAVLLAKSSRYKPAMAVAYNPLRFAEELESCGYSTNPQYAETLSKLIATYDLTQYDITPSDPAAVAAA